MKIKIDPRIEEILLKEWDPIGVKSNPNASAEYRTYANQVFGMLSKGSTEQQIAAYLTKVVTDDLELRPSKSNIEAVAKKLVSLKVT